MEFELRRDHLLGPDLISMVLDSAFFRCVICSELTVKLYGLFGKVESMCWICDDKEGEEEELRFRAWSDCQL